MKIEIVGFDMDIRFSHGETWVPIKLLLPNVKCDAKVQRRYTTCTLRYAVIAVMGIIRT